MTRPDGNAREAGATPPPPADAREMLARARSFLERKGVEEWRLEAELLVGAALGLDRMGLFLALDRPVEPREVARGRELLVRRAAGEPTAYLLGRREFYGRPFAVGTGVLIPRPETEHLVDYARERGAGRSGLRVADFGTGSGCLAVTLALELDDPEVHAFDVSPEALAYARRNAEALGAEVAFHEGDGLGPLLERGPWDLVVANPPYVDPRTRLELAIEVRDHEPELALFAPLGDVDHWARLLLDRSDALLTPGGTLLIELGHDQAARLGGRGLVHADYGGVPRVLECTRAG